MLFYVYSFLNNFIKHNTVLKRALIAVFSVYITTLVYAIVRYNIFGGVEWHHLPLYINNKAISVTVLVCLGLTIIPGQNPEAPHLKRLLGQWVFLGALLHMVIGAVSMVSGQYAKFFDAQGGLTLWSELSLLGGSLAFVLVVWLQFRKLEPGFGLINQARNRTLGQLALAAVLVHTTAMGLPGWLAIEKWPGTLPPISLISAIMATVLLLVNFRAEKK